jgi:enoyl-CoA hydratase/carnithine racemase
VMTGEMVPAERALALGLVEELHPPEELLPRAMAFAELLATKAPLALGLGKLVLNKCLDVDLDTGRTFERLAQSVLKRSSDHEEGARAFIEKRKPRFSGR